MKISEVLMRAVPAAALAIAASSSAQANWTGCATSCYAMHWCLGQGDTPRMCVSYDNPDGTYGCYTYSSSYCS